ncbi:radical SAM protein [Candidatus Falkowbacteria bacterium]|nr:radical SAM protein [Candidatus Falkowbacteria bacterium]
MVGNLVRACGLNLDHILPYLVVYHANYACNAACSFCGRAADIAKARNGSEIPIEEIETIFWGLRSLVPSLYVAGGEPLLQRNIEAILELARAMNFWPVAVNTNATLLDERPDVCRFADKIVVSIHSTDVAAAADIFHIRPRMVERMFDNIRHGAIEAQRHGNRVVGNCVLTGQNTASAHKVLDFCLKYGIPLSIVPAIEEYWPTVERANAPVRADYVRFVERVITTKRANPDAVHGSIRFLERVRDLGSFACRPTSIMSVDPHGNIIIPCQYKYAGTVPQHLGRITATRDAASILHTALNYRTPFQACDKRCLKACYAEPAVSIETPLALALEFLPLAGLQSLSRKQ